MVAWYQASSVLLAVLTAVWYSNLHQHTKYIEEPLDQYDYIIVGAGTAGCVLAERLSRNPETQVLLVESGEEPSWITRIPFLSPLVQNGGNDWKFRTIPQSNSSMALNNRKAAWPQGKMLGGTGQLNFLIHSIGVPADFDLWNVPGWDSGTMEKYFRRIQFERKETCPAGLQIPDCNRTSTHRTCSHGSLKTTQVNPTHSAIANAFLESAKSLDYPIRDLNDWSRGRDVWGFMMSQNTISEGIRWSTYESHLKPSLQRNNLHVMITSTVSKVILKERKCVGVEILKRNQKNVSARKEVILSAGAVKTPQILQLSGIGPSSLLHSLGIPVVADLPVGENLQDHLQIPLFIELTAKVSNTAMKLLSLRHLWDYLVHKKAVRQGLELVEAEPFQELGARALLPEFPECAKPYSKDNDEYLRCLAHTIAITMYHPAGTCSMGNDSAISVVDPRLRVKGIEGLRVMDASVIPRLTSGPSNSVIAAMAERAADVILDLTPSP